MGALFFLLGYVWRWLKDDDVKGMLKTRQSFQTGHLLYTVKYYMFILIDQFL